MAHESQSYLRFLLFTFSPLRRKRERKEKMSAGTYHLRRRGRLRPCSHTASASAWNWIQESFFFFFGFFFHLIEENDELIIHQWPPTEEKEKKLRWTCRHNFFLDGGISFDSVSKDGRPTDTHWQLTASFFFLVEKFSLFFSFLVVVRVVHQEFGFAL